MATLQVYNINGSAVDKIEVSDALVGVPQKQSVLLQVVLWQQSRARAYTAHTKTRGSVSGGGKKPWKQKGTGRARQGSTRAPQWRHGAIIFGPNGSEHSRQNMPKRVRNLALRMAISNRVANGALKVVDQIRFDQPKTKEAAAMLRTLEIRKPLVVVDSADEATNRSFRNLPNAKLIAQEGLNTLDVLKYPNCIVTVGALRKLEERLVGAQA